MIIDHIGNRALYAGLGERYRAALEYFAKINDHELPMPTTEQDAALCEGVIIRVRPMITKPESECRFEAHVRDVDIHFVPTGLERIGYATLDTLTPTVVDEANDLIFLEGEGTLLTLRAGYFMFSFPHDGHKPCICGDIPQPLTKLIAKVRIADS